MYSTGGASAGRPRSRRIRASNFAGALIVVSVSVRIDSIGTRCRTGANDAAGAPATRCVGESGVTSDGMLRFERLQLAEQRVVLGVADGRRVEHVVAMVVLLDLAPQRGDARPDRGGDPGGAHHDPATASRRRQLPNSAIARGLPGSMLTSVSAAGGGLHLLADRGERGVVERAPIVVDQDRIERLRHPLRGELHLVERARRIGDARHVEEEHRAGRRRCRSASIVNASGR